MKRLLLLPLLFACGCQYAIRGLDVDDDGGVIVPPGDGGAPDFKTAGGEGGTPVPLDFTVPVDQAPSPDLAVFCTDAVCKAAVGPGGACCNAACVNTSTDPSHCGGCGKVCGAGTTCCGGACVDLNTSAAHCGACGNGCTSGKCGKAIAASMQSQPTDWKFNGDAYYSGTFNLAVLTSSGNFKAGTVIYQNGIVTDDFTADFDFQMIFGGASGLAFMITTSGNAAVGNSSGGLGVAGLAGFGVEFDTADSGSGCGETNDNHVSVIKLAACPSDGDLPTPLGAQVDPGVTMSSDSWHKARVELVSRKVTVYVDNKKVIDQFDLGAAGFVTGTKYWFGFGGGTGNSSSQFHEIRNVNITFPTARCL